MSDAAFFVFAFSSLFAIVNPFSTAFVFVTITQNDSEKKKMMMAKKACLTSFFVMVFFVLAGDFVLKFFSITVESLRIAGGIFVAYIGFMMLNHGTLQKGATPEHMKEHIKKPDVSIVPLSIPFISGPGTISTLLLLTSQNHTPSSLTIILLSVLMVIVLTYYILLNAKYLSRYLGSSGTKILEKLMGLIILTVGVQFILSGIALYAKGI